MSIVRQLFVVALAAIVLAGGWVYLGPLLGFGEEAGGKSGGGKKSPAAVVVADVSFVRERLRTEAVGTARAYQSARLHPVADGRVIATALRTDGNVSQGQVLLELDHKTETLAVELARVRLEAAQRVAERLTKLRKSGASTQAALDDAVTAVDAAKIELERAQLALEDRFLLAPFSGRIGMTDIEVGDRVDTGTEIAVLDDRSSLLVRFEVPEGMLGRIGVGSPVKLALWTGDTAPIEGGSIYDIDSRIDEATRTFVVRARIPNPDDRLRPGMSFRVTLDVEGETRASVPEVAIQWGGDGSFVWAVSGGTARRLPVSIVQRQEATVLLDAEFAEGDKVVTHGLHRMREGTKVEILPGNGPAQPPIKAEQEATTS
ncbi:efflux RND transporter periplasmic adaptor subunit [Nisaea acidiphila]|uniref:Efflux RND transporter periplasmic adaptor subunit n=1 Tax=Nisaea acidiphila TaxID=1862145 RepID=A0A9J7AWP7_9PROT|nr:efflux RND transporter periplasmic adaptor subunit [Nisaea acidiphila]UUX51720.1 efflux RND transporter periplasmic adaptor subunit [Nisaea acidiphila]